MSVVVCCRDRAALLTEALWAVGAAMRPGDELVVVDSASRDGSVAAAARAAGARLVPCAQPGLAVARNAGWAAAARPLVAFTDDDCRPATDWLAEAARVFADPAVVAVWGQVLPAGRSALELSLLDDDAPREASLTDDVSAFGHGANMVFRRSALAAVGGFDPRLGVGSRLRSGEDKDMFWRLLRAGLRVRYAPELVVTHAQWRSGRAGLRVMYGYGVGAGALAAKRHRLDGTPGLVRAELWRHGLLPAARGVRSGRFGRAAGATARAAGVLSGVLSARRSR